MRETKPSKSLVAMVVLLSLHAICGVAVLCVLWMVVPHCQMALKQAGAALPGMTLMLIKISRPFAWICLVMSPGLAAADFAIMFFLRRAGLVGLMTAWGIMAWLAELLLIGLILVAITEPLTHLLQNLVA